MKITIHPPLGFSEKGRRSTNQDSIAPSLIDVSAETALFIVCDGVGGAADGEKASFITANGFYRHLDGKTTNERLIHSALNEVQSEIDQYLKENQESKGMGTTLALLHLNKKGALVAHIGDSRVYQIRDGAVVFCTEDHSLINTYKKQGIKDAHLAKSNVITRAIQGNSVKEVQADTTLLTDIRENDYFLLCSDGVWGSFSEEALTAVLNSDSTDEQKVDTIKERCESDSKDNYSAFLLKINTVETVDGEDDPALTDDYFSENPQKIHVFEEPAVNHPRFQKSVFGWGALLAVFICGYLYYFSGNNKTNVGGQSAPGQDKNISPADSASMPAAIDTLKK